MITSQTYYWIYSTHYTKRKLYRENGSYDKAFDAMRQEKLVEISQTQIMDKLDLRIITNLYWNQRAQTIVDNETSPEIEILKRVRQGCIMCPPTI